MEEEGTFEILAAPLARREAGRFVVKPMGGEEGCGSRTTEGLWRLDGDLVVAEMTKGRG